MKNRTTTAIRGIDAGHETDESGATGVTAFLFRDGAAAAHMISGHASGSRELDVLSETHVSGVIHGLCFAGGSAYGLAAADGVVRALAERGIGYEAPHGLVPLVPAAIIYDLDRGRVRPDAEMGYRAARAATSSPLPEGPVGAGAGASVAKVTGTPQPAGVGSWAERQGAWTVAATAVVNASGAIRDPESARWVAGEIDPQRASFDAIPIGNTTLALIATDAALDRRQLRIAARMANAAIARTHWPAFTPFDGDIVFAVSTGDGEPGSTKTLLEVGALASWCLERAILRAVGAG
ncbi:MAG: putative aminopeptidase [Calditrichaeota bacterium]|nr:putative aminopeptidase [Calditrichota bacterium]